MSHEDLQAGRQRYGSVWGCQLVLVLRGEETRMDEGVGAASRLQNSSVSVGMPGVLWSLFSSWHGFSITCVGNGQLKHELLVLSRWRKGV